MVGKEEKDELACCMWGRDYSISAAVAGQIKECTSSAMRMRVSGGLVSERPSHVHTTYADRSLPSGNNAAEKTAVLGSTET